MERLLVDGQGQIVIPPEVTHKRGLRPGDEVALLEITNGLLVYQKGLAFLEDWWNSLTPAEKIEARQEAEEYEALSEEERDAIWNQFPESIEEEDEGDELDLTASEHPLR